MGNQVQRLRLGEILRVALGSRAANKLRFLLTILGIIIGVGSVITMTALGKEARRQVAVLEWTR